MKTNNKIRCKAHIAISSSRRFRRCKNKTSNTFCHIHEKYDFGHCCFCNDDCNPASQTCGRCARIASWYGLDALTYMLYKK